MNKTLLMIFACVVLTVDGQEELRKEGSDAAQVHPHPSGFSKGESENISHEREKRMPDSKIADDGSYGYAWNVGSGVSYMKMHVGKTNKLTGIDNFAAAQHEVVNSLRDGGHSHLSSNNEKTSYEKIHNDFIKTSQQISSQKNKKLSVKPAIVNQKTLEMGKPELTNKDKNFAKFAFDTDQNKGIKDVTNNKFHESNTKLKQEYEKFNKDIQLSGWPQQQGLSLKELDFAKHLKSSQSNEEGGVKYAENKPINGFEYDQGLVKSLQSQQTIPFSGSVDGIYKSVQIPIQESIIGRNNGFTIGKETNVQGLNTNEDTFQVASQQNEGRSVINNPASVELGQNNGEGGENDAVFKYIGETGLKNEDNEEHTVPTAFGRSQRESWSTQDIFRDHHSNIEDAEHKRDFEQTTKTIDGDNIQKYGAEISFTPNTLVEYKPNQFQVQHESNEEGNIHPQIVNSYGSDFVQGMHPAMNQKLINDQIERIKHIQQKVLATYFPGASIHDVLGGKTRHGFTFPGYPMRTQENFGSWKEDEENKRSEKSRINLAQDIHNNREAMNINLSEETSVPNDGTESSSYTNVRLGHLAGDSRSHKPFLNNNVRSPKFMQNNLFGAHKLTNDDRSSGSESHDERETESVWKPQRYTIKPKNQHYRDLRKDTHESVKEDSSNVSDERKGREIKSSFEHEGRVHLDQKDTPLLDEQFHESGVQEEKTNHDSVYSHFHKYSHQEPQVRVITKAVPVHKKLKIPVPQMVRHPILIPVPYKVLEPYPIKIPVPVTVEKTVEVPVEKVIHYPVEKPVPMKVVKEIRVPVPKPYPVKVPVYKIKYVHHNKKKKHNE